MKDKVWNALHDAKLGVEYTTLYSLKIERRRRNYKKIIILTAFLGAALFIFWSPAALTACILIFAGESLIKFNNQIIMNDDDFIKLSDLKIKYSQLFNKLERLMIDISENCLPQEEVNKLYSQILDNKIALEKILEELNLPANMNISLNAKQTTETYLTDHFNL